MSHDHKTFEEEFQTRTPKSSNQNAVLLDVMFWLDVVVFSEYIKSCTGTQKFHGPKSVWFGQVSRLLLHQTLGIFWVEKFTYH